MFLITLLFAGALVKFQLLLLGLQFIDFRLVAFSRVIGEKLRKILAQHL